MSIFRSLRHVRMAWCALIAAVLWAALWYIAPREAVTVLYKVTTILTAAVAAYWVDRLLFPYAEPEGYLEEEWRDLIDAGQWPDGTEDFPVVTESRTLFAVACLRRTVLMAVAMLAMGLAL